MIRTMLRGVYEPCNGPLVRMSGMSTVRAVQVKGDEYEPRGVKMRPKMPEAVIARPEGQRELHCMEEDRLTVDCTEGFEAGCQCLVSTVSLYAPKDLGGIVAVVS